MAVWTYFPRRTARPGHRRRLDHRGLRARTRLVLVHSPARRRGERGRGGRAGLSVRRDPRPGGDLSGRGGKEPLDQQHLAQGQQFGKYHTTAEYSYRGEHSAEDGLVLVGDAFAFLDPVFSSGVYLALRSGETGRRRGTRGVAGAATSRPPDLCRTPSGCAAKSSRCAKLVYVFYDKSFSFGKLIRANPEIRGDLTDCLIGNLDKDFGQLFQAVEEQTAIPEPLKHGRPLLKA